MVEEPSPAIPLNSIRIGNFQDTGTIKMSVVSRGSSDEHLVKSKDGE